MSSNGRRGNPPRLARVLGANIRAQREARGWCQQALAAEVGTSAGTLSELERGMRGCSLGMVERYADAFCVSPASLLVEAP